MTHNFPLYGCEIITAKAPLIMKQLNGNEENQIPTLKRQKTSDESTPDPQSPRGGAKQFKRSYKACLNCRTRKIKCDLGSPNNPMDPPCARCRRERKDCVFVESRRGVSGKKKKDGETTNSKASQSRESSVAIEFNIANESHERYRANNIQSNPRFAQPNPEPKSIINSYSKIPLRNNSSEVSTMQGALLFLANAAGDMAKADDRDRLNGGDRQRKFAEEYERRKGNSGRNGKHLNINNDTANGNFMLRSDSKDSAPNGSPRISSPYTTEHSPLLIPPVRSYSDIEPIVPTTSLSYFDYIGEGKLLSEDEAIELVDFFFNYMHPFYPYIPPDLHDAKTLTGYPILLVTILTIASRYKPVNVGNDSSDYMSASTGEGSEILGRRLETHEKLWIYSQKLVSQTVWAEASTRSIGTVYSFLLFTEWNPRAIHWRWNDYANSGMDSNSSDIGSSNNFKSGSAAADSGDVKTGERESQADKNSSRNKQNDEDSLAGLGALRRSSRMAWLLIGTAIRLAQDMGFMENSSRVFVAAHISETTTAMSVGQRSMLAQSLTEINLNDDASFEESYQVEDDMVLKGDEEALRLKTDTTLKFTPLQRANVELLKITSLAYETLYSGKSFASSDQKQRLAILSILSPLLESWEAKYRKWLNQYDSKFLRSSSHLLKNAAKLNKIEKAEVNKVVDHESLRFDYFYAQLYIYSLALFSDSAQHSTSKKNLSIEELSKAAKYTGLAFQAAKEILATATRIHKLKVLRFMPVRWVTRIVRSVAFVVKCYMTLTSNIKSNTYTSTIVGLSVIPIDDIIQTIQKAAITLREASPDELHLCTRYSTILMYLCSEMRASAAAAANNSMVKKSSDVVEPKANLNNQKSKDEPVSITENRFQPNTSSSSTAQGISENQGTESYNDFSQYGTSNYQRVPFSKPSAADIADPSYRMWQQQQQQQASPHRQQQQSAIPAGHRTYNTGQHSNQQSQPIYPAQQQPYAQATYNNINSNTQQPQTPQTLSQAIQNPTAEPVNEYNTQTIPDLFSNYFDNELQDIMQSNSWVGLNFVEPLTDLIEQQMRENTNNSVSNPYTANSKDNSNAGGLKK